MLGILMKDDTTQSKISGVIMLEPEPRDLNIATSRTTAPKKSNKLKVLIVMFIAVVFGALGDVSLSKGMKAVNAMATDGVINTFIATMTNPYVIGGIFLLIVFLCLYLASLSWEELSYVLPLTAADYVLVTLFAYFLLKEDVSPLRWTGSVLVAIGIGLVART